MLTDKEILNFLTQLKHLRLNILAKRKLITPPKVISIYEEESLAATFATKQAAVLAELKEAIAICLDTYRLTKKFNENAIYTLITDINGCLLKFKTDGGYYQPDGLDDLQALTAELMEKISDTEAKAGSGGSAGGGPGFFDKERAKEQTGAMAASLGH